MKITKGFIKTAFKVIEKETGRQYDCFIQYYEYTSGVNEVRFNIGINRRNEWLFIHYVDEHEFNERYTIA